MRIWLKWHLKGTGLTEKLRDPNAASGPYSELKRSYWIKLAAKAAALLTFVWSMREILTNDKLTPAQQIIQITALTAFTIAANVGAAAIGIYFAAPITGAVIAIGLAVVLAFINDWVNALAIELVTF